MTFCSPYTLPVVTDFDQAILLKNCWITVLHASRIPPHVGLMINGQYSSLTIKGRETGVKAEALLKTITQKKIKALAIELVKHPVFSADYQKEVFEHTVNQFTRVGAHEASCLSPVKLFLQEFYALSYHKHELLFEVVERLKQNAYIYRTVAFNVDQDLQDKEFPLPVYTPEKLQEAIKKEMACFNL